MKVDSGRTHYLKWKLDIGDGHYSIRYHFLWQDKKELERCYVLKHHLNSTVSKLDEKMARMMINKHTIAQEEILADVQMMNADSDVNRVHKKTVITDSHIKSFFGARQDVELNKMKHKFYD